MQSPLIMQRDCAEDFVVSGAGPTQFTEKRSQACLLELYSSCIKCCFSVMFLALCSLGTPWDDSHFVHAGNKAAIDKDWANRIQAWNVAICFIKILLNNVL